MPNFDAVLKEAYDLRGKRKYQDAIALYQHALANTNEPQKAEIYFLIAATYHENHCNNEAIVAYQKAIQHEPQYKEAHFNLATLYASMGNYAQSLRYFDALFSFAMELPAALLNAAIVATYIDDWQKVITYTKNLLAMQNIGDAQKLKALMLLGQAYKEQQEYELAHNALQKAYQLNSNNSELNYQLAQLYALTGDAALAQEFLTKSNLNAGQNSAEVYYNLGVNYHKSGDYAQADLYYQQALAHNPHYFAALYNAGSIAQKLNDLPRALALYKQAQNIQPDFENLNFLISALEQTNNNINRVPQRFVVELFDNYANNFDTELIRDLKYQTPTILRKLLDETLPHFKARSILDLGCGTGLSALPFYDLAEEIVGIDLSSQMLAQAQQKELYSLLICGDLEKVDFQALQIPASDLIVAADIFVYFGDLLPLLQKYAANLTQNGAILFSCEELTEDKSDYILSQDCRFKHSRQYIEKLSKRLNFNCKIKSDVLRINHGQPVQGLVVCFYVTVHACCTK